MLSVYKCNSFPGTKIKLQPKQKIANNMLSRENLQNRDNREREEEYLQNLAA